MAVRGTRRRIRGIFNGISLLPRGEGPSQAFTDNLAKVDQRIARDSAPFYATGAGLHVFDARDFS